MMTLNEKLLGDARAIRDKLIDVQFEADRQALAYQHAIRKLHAAGGSLREIAEALGLSHQRVHQIVDPESGKGALKQEKRKKAPRYRSDRPLRCSFCDRPQDEVQKLIAGPGAYICDECVDLGSLAIQEQARQWNDLTTIKLADPAAKPRCNFCGKELKKVKGIVTPEGGEPVEARVKICNECLDLCNEIMTEEGHRPKKK
jgi:hypothetical protein